MNPSCLGNKLKYKALLSFTLLFTALDNLWAWPVIMDVIRNEFKKSQFNFTHDKPEDFAVWAVSII